MKKALISTTVSVLAATMITGCFSSNNNGAAAADTVTKVFADTVVEGLGYSCAGGAVQLTNAAGQFTCNAGDQVTFSIGDVVLGALTAATSLPSEVSPYTLSPNDNTVAVNIAQLIQSCDDDGVLAPTIVIDANKTALFVPSTITVDSATFDTDANTTLSGALVSNKSAEAHLINNAPDITPPVVTLDGNTTVNLREGSTYTDAGATATDTKDGALTPVKSGTVDTATIGTYTITWTATDAAGNVGTADRTVNVVANVAPVVTLNGAASMTIRQNDAYTELGATASDAEDGNVTASIVISGDTVDTSTAGVYTLTYTATDAEGKTGTAERTVTVEEDKAPVVTLLGSNPVTVAQGTVYTDAGATAEDDFDGDVSSTLVMTGDTVDTNNPGATYTIIWTATDNSANDGTATRTVNIEDKAPVVTLVGNAAMTCGLIGGAYTDAGATATDDKDGALTPVESGTVDLDTAGTYTITWTATDSAGQSATADRTLTVSCQNVNPITGGCEDTPAKNYCQ